MTSAPISADDPELDLVRWLFLDLNSYFASCEQQLNPRLRGKPIAVVPSLADTTCVIAASYEAKKFRIKTGTPVGEAKLMCPGLILVDGDHENYIRFHEQILEAVGTVLPIEAVLSIDEMGFRLIGSERKLPRAMALAHELKHAIQTKVGECLTSSIGLAPNRFLAKVASDMQKPDGLTTLTLRDLPKKLLILKPRDFPGIGPRMEQRLLRHGIVTAEQLLALSETRMREIWGGVVGERYFAWLRGEETAEVPTQRQSITHSHVLPPAERNREDAFRILQKLVIKAAYRLRRDELWAKRMEIYVRFAKEEESFSVGEGFFETQDTFSFLKLASEFWEKLPPDSGRPYQVGMAFTGLVADGFHTPSFFEDPRRIGVSRSVDQLNAKFGKGTVYFGSQHEGRKVGQSAPLRIAFTRIPSLDENF